VLCRTEDGPLPLITGYETQDPAEHTFWLRMILGSELATQTYYYEPMPSRVPIASTALLVGLLLASAPALAQEEPFFQRFDEVLSQPGWWGRCRHRPLQEPGTQLFFGEARKATHQPVDGETSYNWDRSPRP